MSMACRRLAGENGTESPASHRWSERQANLPISWGGISIVALALSISAASVHSQAPTVLRESMCRACLSIEQGITLGDATDAGAVSVGRGLLQLRDGSFLHADGRGGVLRRFSSRGLPLGEIGRAGSGPLEFREIDWIMRDSRDTLVVFDLGNGRASTISPTLKQVRQFSITHPVTSASFLPTGHIVANIHFADSPRVGVPVHVIDRNSGTILASFGRDDDETFDSRAAWAGWREIAVSPAGTIWTARRNAYRLEEWDAHGRKLRSLERRVNWFVPYSVRTRLSPTEAPQPHVERIHMDSDGRLWVFIAVPAADWRRSVVARRPSPGILPGFEPVSLSGIYDTIVEIIDTSSGSVIASARLADYAWGMLSDGLIYSDAQAEDGVPRYRLWTAAFRGPTSTTRR